MPGCCERGYQFSGPIKDIEFLEELSDPQLLKEGST
jgi:hypothetical protein